MRFIPLAVASTLLASNAVAAGPPPLARHVCPNGLEVLVAERHAAPLVTVEIAVHNGAMTEPPEYNGLSHLYEHMFFKGNKALPDQTGWMARSRELGLSWNGTTDVERVNYFFTTTSDHFADTMVFMRDAITGLLFEAKELERERVVVTGEIDRNESDPNYFLWHEPLKHLFWKYPSRKDPLGNRKTVLSATPEMMRTIQSRYYVPNNSVLVVTGDVSAADVFKRADELYVDWKKNPDPFVRFPLVHHPTLLRSEVIVIEKPVQTFAGRLFLRGPSTGDRTVNDSYTADLLGVLLGDPASRFQKTLVDSGACVRAEHHYWTQRNDGVTWIDFESTEANVDVCLPALRAELSKIEAPDYFTDEELRNAAHHLEVGLAKDRETDEEYAHQITMFWTWATPSLDYYATYVDRIHAVTRVDIARYMHGYVLGRPFVLGAIASPKLVSAGTNREHLESLVGIASPKGSVR